MSSSSSTNNKKSVQVTPSEAQRGPFGQQHASETQFMCVVVSTAPGRLENTIPMSFEKQMTRKDRIASVTIKHDVASRQRIIRQLTLCIQCRPTSFRDAALFQQSLLLWTTTHLQGNLQLDDGTTVSMKQCVVQFANDSKSRYLLIRTIKLCYRFTSTTLSYQDYVYHSFKLCYYNPLLS